MKQPEILAEIARLESEVQRLGRELEALKRRVDPSAVTKRTQAFAAPVIDPPASAAESAPPRSPKGKHEPKSVEPKSVEPKSVEPKPAPPQPSAAPKTGTRTIPPTSSRRSHELGDTIPPPQGEGGSGSNPRRAADSDRQSDAGRYGFVSDSSRPRNTKRG